MIIKQIKVGKNNFYTVTFETGEKMKVSEDLLVRYRLLKGTEITPEVFEELKSSAGFDMGLQMAYNYISYQLRSEKEMDQYLKIVSIKKILHQYMSMKIKLIQDF